MNEPRAALNAWAKTRLATSAGLLISETSVKKALKAAEQ
jgi:hypothetical protein